MIHNMDIVLYHQHEWYEVLINETAIISYDSKMRQQMIMRRLEGDLPILIIKALILTRDLLPVFPLISPPLASLLSCLLFLDHHFFDVPQSLHFFLTVSRKKEG